jgi:hypothetical protein
VHPQQVNVVEENEAKAEQQQLQARQIDRPAQRFEQARRIFASHMGKNIKLALNLGLINMSYFYGY